MSKAQFHLKFVCYALAFREATLGTHLSSSLVDFTMTWFWGRINQERAWLFVLQRKWLKAASRMWAKDLLTSTSDKYIAIAVSSLAPAEKDGWRWSWHTVCTYIVHGYPVRGGRRKNKNRHMISSTLLWANKDRELSCTMHIIRRIFPGTMSQTR